ncbi:MAG: hypothetical protein ACM3WQ_05875 [Chloroflexota bacterium]|nr:hypothetical protein [Candidatus Sulfotelmatobacter sp.]
MVKIVTTSGDRDRFDSKDVEKDLEAAGFPERIAEEISERVENKVQDGWTVTQVKEQVKLEINRLKEDIDRATDHYTSVDTSREKHEGTETRREEARREEYEHKL